MNAPNFFRRALMIQCLGIGVVVYTLLGSMQVANAQSEENEAGVELYAKVLKPLFQTRCYPCHGALKQQANLRLDTVSLMKQGGDSGNVLDGSDESQVLLWQRVSTSELADRMPPEHEGEAFDAVQLQALRDWIRSGSPGPMIEEAEPDPKQHWAFQSIDRPVPVPELRSRLPSESLDRELHHASGSHDNPIDAFLDQRMELMGLEPLPEAEPHSLIRRAYFDLIGILPQHQEQRQWLERSELDSNWYVQMVDTLLEDPRHGERWARHWMDVWRYSDWWGLGDQLRNSHKHIWHWRDWIVRSLNRDLPYDQMLRSMLAADELTPNDFDQLPGLGYLARNYFLFNRHQWMDETVEHVGKGMMGLTFNCAKCHDHKYDPITQEEYYGLRAIFETYQVRTEMLPGEADLSRNGLPVAFDSDPEATTWFFIRGDENRPDKSRPIKPNVPAILRPGPLEILPVSLPRESYQPQSRSWVLENYRTASDHRVELAKAALSVAEKELAAIQVTSIAKEECSADLERLLASDNENQIQDVFSRFDKRPEGERLWMIVYLRWMVRQREWLAVVAERQSIEAKSHAEAVESDQTQFETPADSNTKMESEPSKQIERSHPTAASQTGKSLAAVSEHQYHLAKAAKDTSQQLLELMTAKDDRALKTKKYLEVRKGEQDQRNSISSEARYQPLTGAEWLPTRFANSTQDDPAPTINRKSSGRRAAFARWLTDRKHPLTARVAVNQIWMRHFGKPLVDPVFDFGRKGKLPQQHALLDWMAWELMDHGWSMKHLHRLIMQSKAYRRQSSVAAELTQNQTDEANVFYWKREPLKLESQVVRDSLLYWSGELDGRMGGPPVLPPDQASSKRRSLYFFHSNNDRSLFLTTFDEALVKECYRREQSIIPQQALALINSGLVHDCAPKIARRLRSHYPRNTASLKDNGLGEHGEASYWIQLAIEEILGREATEAEIEACQRAWKAWQDAGPEEDPLAQLVWVLINHHDMITIP